LTDTTNARVPYQDRPSHRSLLEDLGNAMLRMGAMRNGGSAEAEPPACRSL